MAVQDMRASKTSFDLTPEDHEGAVINVMHATVLTSFLQKITEDAVIIMFSNSGELATFTRVFRDAITAASKTMDEEECSLIIYNNDDSRK